MKKFLESLEGRRELTEGYSHYYDHKGFSDKGWLKFLKDVGVIVKKAKKEIAVDFSSDGTYIMFNGKGADGYEDILITFAPQAGFNSVKTAYKAYDPFVIEIMKAAKKNNRGFKMRSDGGKEVFESSELSEASEVDADELSKEQMALLKSLKLDKRIDTVWSGIHGYIVDIKGGIQVGRIGKDDMKKMIKSPAFRWYEGSDKGITIGF